MCEKCVYVQVVGGNDVAGGNDGVKNYASLRIMLVGMMLTMDLLCQYQSGFRPGYSTEIYVTEIIISQNE